MSLTLHSEFGLGFVIQRFTGVDAPVSVSHTLEDQSLLSSINSNIHAACGLQHYAVLHPLHFI